ncbi:hypothetical protein DI272_01760 [Streptomyces sp. Act143]|uniref:TetR/AcrR family transcriptional regulator n=1 Tax=Streptomyces sp. Act143 TaxID=2200760 RepID=UPI000D68525D|nr:TetR/AcrR family transcriptional regulator [Streptomyces sp. Act143]PWI13003.1 hypothetical protein DI272_01760 [Streptomyces sp. Act143]
MIAASGVAKSTLSVHFRTKEELVAAYLRRTDDSWTAQLQDAATRAGDGPREQLDGLFDALTEAFDRHGFFGCPFVSAAVEADLDSEARTITVRHTQRRHSWLTRLSERAGAGAPDTLARHIGLLTTEPWPPDAGSWTAPSSRRRRPRHACWSPPTPDPSGATPHRIPPTQHDRKEAQSCAQWSSTSSAPR